MNSAASEKEIKWIFWSTCSPSPSYVLIQRCCHKLRKINSVQSVGPGWKPDSIRNTTFLRETKTHEREQWTGLDPLDWFGGFLSLLDSVCSPKSRGIDFSLTSVSRSQRKNIFFLEIKELWSHSYFHDSSCSSLCEEMQKFSSLVLCK